MALVGAFTNNITPKTTVDLNGYILRFGKSQGIHDNLTANFLYIESCGKKALLISLDILTISTESSTKLRHAIAKQMQIESDAIIIAAIHTHSAVGQPYLRNVGKENEDWREDFERKILSGSIEAKNRAVECDLYSYEAFSGVGINRRKETRGIDPHAPFIVIKKGTEIAAWLINYSCHAVCLTEKNLFISADYVHYLREHIYKILDQKFPILFFNGGSGDIDPKLRGSFEDAERTGKKLAEEILLIYKVYKGKALSTNVHLRVSKMTIPYSWQPTFKEAEDNLQLYSEKLKSAESREEKKVAKAFFQWASDVLNHVESGTMPKSLEVNIYFLMLGELMFLAVPLEIFSSISMKLRKIFGGYTLFVVSYGNGYEGYLADRAAHYEGGYEIEDWHKYAGILPKVTYVEDIFLETINNYLSKKDENLNVNTCY